MGFQICALNMAQCLSRLSVCCLFSCWSVSEKWNDNDWSDSIHAQTFQHGTQQYDTISWIYWGKFWLQHSRWGPVHSHESCSIGHEAKIVVSGRTDTRSGCLVLCLSTIVPTPHWHMFTFNLTFRASAHIQYVITITFLCWHFMLKKSTLSSCIADVMAELRYEPWFSQSSRTIRINWALWVKRDRAWYRSPSARHP